MTKAKPAPQPLPQTGGSFILEKGDLKQTAATKPAPTKGETPRKSMPTKEA